MFDLTHDTWVCIFTLLLIILCEESCIHSVQNQIMYDVTQAIWVCIFLIFLIILCEKKPKTCNHSFGNHTDNFIDKAWRLYLWLLSRYLIIYLRHCHSFEYGVPVDLRVPDLQRSCTDLTGMSGYQDCSPSNGSLLADTQNCGLRMRRECRERFFRHRGLPIPTCITARAWCTCRDACRDL